MSPPKPCKRLSLRRADRPPQPAPDPAAPRHTFTPWHGHGPGDWPREVPLAQCPSARCRRGRHCIAAVTGLYCQRTHYSREEQVVLAREHPLARALKAVPPVADPASLSERMERIAELAAARRDYDKAMTGKWKAGLLPARFGRYKASGVVLVPPPRSYVDAAKVQPRSRTITSGGTPSRTGKVEQPRPPDTKR